VGSARQQQTAEALRRRYECQLADARAAINHLHLHSFERLRYRSSCVNCGAPHEDASSCSYCGTTRETP
jgi:ribosomal protein S27AE